MVLFALPWEKVVAEWLKKNNIEYEFHPTVLGENPTVGIVAPFVIGKQVIASREMSTPQDTAIAGTNGYDIFAVSEDDPVKDLET